MFDFSFGELAVIGAVALVVLGPERLPKVARTVGEWAGKAQRYVSQVKADINREMEVAELKKLQEQARGIAHEFESAVQSEVKGIESSVSSAVDPSKPDVSTLGADAWNTAAGRRRTFRDATSPGRVSTSCPKRSRGSSASWRCPRSRGRSAASSRRGPASIGRGSAADAAARNDHRDR